MPESTEFIHIGNIHCPFCGTGGTKNRILTKRFVNYKFRFSVTCAACQAVGPETDTPCGAARLWDARGSAMHYDAQTIILSDGSA